MEITSAFRVTASDGSKPGAFATFPYDRELVRRFREAFPRARWRADEECWFVPGTTAVRRLNAWISQELETLDRHADDKGRDAFAFEPLASPYLIVGDDLAVRTPYSRTVVEAMRRIPWARWDPAAKIWRVPFRSYDALLSLWPEIEAAARRNEPEARRRRRQKMKDQGASPVRQTERRRFRYPVPEDELPPLGELVATRTWGIVIFEAVDTEPLREVVAEDLYPHVKPSLNRYVWAHWRVPLLSEIYRARPAKAADDPMNIARRGWWLPDREELREKARELRRMERSVQTRRAVSDH
ncbi:hypothetical protein [Microvirga puerhi]|uniref:HARP domain-containing protein n=1 Tax=Microvirga puerhi TaxID=2876078 RepID=A0ABS7VSQ2_9HYPH|nr:hypothetical protein [Microvirga puerhi]MBZ6078581.1 hypothetical protein [Microvirga puerhi]